MPTILKISLLPPPWKSDCTQPTLKGFLTAPMCWHAFLRELRLAWPCLVLLDLAWPCLLIISNQTVNRDESLTQFCCKSRAQSYTCRQRGICHSGRRASISISVFHCAMFTQRDDSSQLLRSQSRGSVPPVTSFDQFWTCNILKDQPAQRLQSHGHLNSQRSKEHARL